MKITRVAAGILQQSDGRFLLGSRPHGKPYAGYWEFPGGKLEEDETALEALRRELDEEMGITVTEATPWLTQRFVYPHAHVELRFFRVTGWKNKITPHEGQSFAWQQVGALNVSPILPANGPILRALALPGLLALSNVAELGEVAFLQKLAYRWQHEAVWLVLREPQLDRAAYRQLVNKVLALPRPLGGKVILHGDIALALETRADGVHLPSRMLAGLSQRPQGLDWIGASTHTLADLQQAEKLGLDYAFLGHVLGTASHPGEAPLGWRQFATLLEHGFALPVYAIGGQHAGTLQIAREHGAHGIAVLRAAWK